MYKKMPLPTEKQLSTMFNVSRITSKKALDKLASEGLIHRTPGRGSYVSQPIKQTGPPLAKDRLIGVILNHSNVYGTKVLEGIEKETSKQKQLVVVKYSYDQYERQECAIRELIEYGVSGLIIMPLNGHVATPAIMEAILAGMPLVCVDRYMKELPLPFVATDNACAAKDMTNYLLTLGHTKVAVVTNDYTQISTLEQRIEGIVKGFAEHGVAIDEHLWCTTLEDEHSEEQDTTETDIQKILQLLQNHPEITAIFALKHDLATLAVEAAKRLSLDIPCDLSIVCFDHTYVKSGRYPFTHISQKQEEMGSTAVLLLNQRIQQPDFTEKVVLDYELIIGQSTIERPISNEGSVAT